MIKPIFRTRAYYNSSSQNKSTWKYSGCFYHYQSYEKPQRQISFSSQGPPTFLVQTTSLPYNFNFYHCSCCLCLMFKTHILSHREKENKWELRGDRLEGQTIAFQCLSQRAALFPLPVFLYFLWSPVLHVCSDRQTSAALRPWNELGNGLLASPSFRHSAIDRLWCDVAQIFSTSREFNVAFMWEHLKSSMSMSRVIGNATSHRHKINEQVDIHVLRFYI